MTMSQYPHQPTELTGAECAGLLGPDWYADDDESVWPSLGCSPKGTSPGCRDGASKPTGWPASPRPRRYSRAAWRMCQATRKEAAQGNDAHQDYLILQVWF